jgi:hypothetical protein
MLMGAPIGNQNAAKAKQWQAAIERALERFGDPSINPDSPIERAPRVKALDALADAFVAKLAAEQDLAFFKEFADRLDGKAHQSTELTGPAGGALLFEEVQRKIT